MVAIVSGNSFGVSSSSAGVLGQPGLFGNAALGNSKGSAFVNISTGNLALQHQDDFLAARGIDVALTRTYNSLGQLGASWRMGSLREVTVTSGALNAAGSKITRTGSDGARAEYIYDTARAAYVTTDGGGAYQTVTYNNAKQQWTWRGDRNDLKGEHELYDAANGGRLVEVRDETGIRLSLTYDARGRLQGIANASGDTTTFDYVGDNLAQIRTNGARLDDFVRVRYGYDERGRLTSVRTDLTPEDGLTADGKVYTTRYAYDGDSDRIATIEESDGSRLGLAYVQSGGAWRVAKTTDALGRVTKYDYSETGKTVVTDPLGTSTTFTYDALGQLTAITGPVVGNLAQTTRYTYDDKGNVTSVIDPLDLKTTFDYDANGNRTLEARPDGTVISRVYDQVSNRLLNESTARYTSAELIANGDFSASGTSGWVLGTSLGGTAVNSAGALRLTARNSTASDYQYAARNVPTIVGAEYEFRVTVMSASAANSAMISVAGNSQFAFSGQNVTVRFKATSTSTFLALYSFVPGAVVVYDNVSLKEVSPSTGGALAIIAPTARFVYDAANRLRFEITPEGRVTEHRYNAQGERTSVIGYTDNTFDASGYTRAKNPTEAQMASWATNANKTQTARTDYLYDIRGLLDSATAYTRVDANGNGIADGSQSTTRYIYDQAGQLLHSFDARNGRTSFVYDGLGRLIATTDALNQSSSTYYDDAGNSVITTMTNGLVRNSVFDRAGQLIGVIEAAPGDTVLGATTYAYDEAGRLRMTVSPGGQRQHRFYDAAGRLGAQVDADGTVTEYVYDANDRLVRTVQYATPTSVAMVDATTGAPSKLMAADVVPSGSLADRSTWNTYDAQGRLLDSVDPEGYLTRRVYDDYGRVVRMLQLTAPLAKEQFRGVRTLTEFTLPTTQQFLETRNFYDNDGRLRGQLDPEGYLSEQRYDSAGRLVERIRYAIATTASLRAQGTLAQLLPVTDLAKEVRERLLYDATGRLVGMLDGESYLTEMRYDANGALSGTVRYGARVSWAAGATIDTLRPKARHANDATASFVYDALGRLILEADATGCVTKHVYDTAGNRISTTLGFGTPEASHSAARYDIQGRLSAQLSPEGIRLLSAASGDGQIDAVWAKHAVRYTYDTDGRRTSMTDPNGNRSVYYYDADGRIAVTVNAMGEVSQQIYDAFGQLETRRDYAARIPAEQLAQLAGGNSGPDLYKAIASIAGGAIRTQNYVYDQRGQLTTSVDGLGYQTTYTYDAFGKVTGNTRRAAPLDSGADPTQDTSSRTFYDRNGRVSFVIVASGLQGQGTAAVPMGVVTEYKYDAHGNVTERITYAKSIAFSTSEADLRTALAGKTLSVADADQHQVNIYNARGNLTTIYTALRGTGTSREWSVVMQDHDSRGNLISRSAFVNSIKSAAPIGTDTSKLVRTTNDVLIRYAYDAEDRLTASATAKDGTGATREWTVTGKSYDRTGRLVLETAYQKMMTGNDLFSADIQAFVDNTANNIASLGNAAIRYGYDDTGRLAVTATAQGLGADGAVQWSVVRNTYDEAGNVRTSTAYATYLSAAFPPGNDTQASYNKWLIDGPAFSAEADRVTQYRYDAANRLLETVSAGGATTRIEYDGFGAVVARATSAPGEASRVSRTVYDANGRPVFQIDALGNVVERRFDSTGGLVMLVRYASPLPTNAVAAATTADDLRRTLAPQAATARSERFILDQSDRVRFSIDEAGYVTEHVYDALGRLTGTIAYERKDLLVGVERLDQTATKTSVTGLVKRTTSYTHNSQGDILTATDATGAAEKFTYDALGRKLTYTNPLNRVWTYAYNAAGRLMSETAPVVTAYAAGTLNTGKGETRTATSMTLVTRFTYDSLGNVLTRTEAAGIVGQERVTSYLYDAAGRQIKTIHPAAKIYDASESLSPLGEAARSESAAAVALTISVTYNAFGEAVASVSAPENGDIRSTTTSQKAYDKLGRVRYEMDGRGYITEYQRDAFGNVTKLIRYATAYVPTAPLQDVNQTSLALASVFGGVSRVIETRYDVLGRAVRVTEPSAYVYDAQSLGTNYFLTAARTTATTYNGFGEVESVAIHGADSNGNAVTEAAGQRNYYDVRGQLSATVQIAASEKNDSWKQGYLTTFAYDAAGNLERRTEYSKVISNWGDTVPVAPSDDALARVTTYGYDAVNRRLRETILASQATGGVDLVTSYGYDSVGNQVSVTAADRTVTYTYYDQLGRVTATAKAHPDHTTKSFPYTEFKLDIHGNVVLRIDYAKGVINAAAGTRPVADAAADRVTATVFDVNGRALQVIDGNNNTINMSYDVLGRAVKEWRTVTDTVSATEKIKRTVFQVTEYDAIGQAIGLRTPGNLDLINAVDRGVTFVSNVFNAYGEITARQVTSAGVTKDLEYTDYDTAGRAWRTNAGDGIDKVMLFDAQGNMTSQIRSKSASNPQLLRTLASAEQALTLQDLIRTDTRYNLMGQVVNVGAVGNIDLLRRDPLTSAWVKVSSMPSVADDFVIVADLEDADKTARVYYRKQGETAWTETATRVSKQGGYSVFATAGLAAGAYEYRVELKGAGNEPAFESANGLLNVESQVSELKQRAVIDLYGVIFGKAPIVTGEFGLNYWVGLANSGVPLVTIAQTMYAQRWTDPNPYLILPAFNNVMEQGLGLPYRYEAGKGASQDQIGRWSGTFLSGNQGQAILDMIAEVKAATAPQLSEAKQRLSNRSDAVFNYVVNHAGNDPATAKRVFDAAEKNLQSALADGTQSGAEQRYQGQIAQLYITLYGRTPDHDGAMFWLARLKDGQSIENVANGMLDDKEALDPAFYPPGQTPEQFVDRVIGILLGRAPSQTELTEWTRRLAGTDGKPAATRGRVVLDIAARVGAYSGSDAALVRERDIFEDKISLGVTSAFVAKRNDPIAVARALIAAVTQNASAQASASAVVAAMASATQLAGVNAAAVLDASKSTPMEDIRLQVSRLYVALLDRAPERDGLEYWVERVSRGQATLDAVANAIIEGAEGRAHYNGTSASAFVEKIYAHALDRPAQAADVAFWAGHIGSRSRGQVAIDVLDAFLRYEGPVTSELTLQARFNDKAALGVTYAVNMAGNSSVAATRLIADYEAGGLDRALANAYVAVQVAYATAAEAAGKAAGAGAALANQSLIVANQLVMSTANAASTESAANNPAAQAVRRLGQLYVGLLRRDQPPAGDGKPVYAMDLPGVMNYLGHMLTGTSDAIIAQGILESAEGIVLFSPSQTPAQFITQLYRQILDREPDQAGLAFWTAAVTSPAKRGQVAVDFLRSVVDHGYPDGESAINKQAELDLIRQFDEKVGKALAGLDKLTSDSEVLADAAVLNVTAAINKANAARANAAAIIADLKNPGNVEAKAVMEITRLYLGVLNRDSVQVPALDVNGLNFYAKNRRDGVSLAAIATGMLESAEGRALFANATTARAFVNQIYLQTLGRSLATNDNFWIDRLNAGASRGEVASDIILSFTEYTVSDTTEYGLRAKFDDRIAAALSDSKFVTQAQTAASTATAAAQQASNAYADAGAEVSRRQSSLDSANAAASSARTALNSSNRAALEEFYAATGYPGFSSYKAQAALGDVTSYITTRIAAMGGSFANRTNFFTNLYRSVLGREPDAAGLSFWVNSPVASADEAAAEFWRGSLRDELRAKSAFINERNRISQAIQTEGNSAINAVAVAQTALKTAQDRQTEALAAVRTASTAEALAKSTPAAASKVASVERSAAIAYRTAAAEITNEKSALEAAKAVLEKASGRKLPALTLDAIKAERAWLDTVDTALGQASTHSNARAALASAKSAVFDNIRLQQNADVLAKRALEYTQVHHAIVGAAPSVAAMTMALADMAAGRTLLELANELIQVYGAGADTIGNEAFVANMFSGALGRAADQAGLRFWSAALSANPPVARNVLVMEFIASVTEKTLNSDTALFARRMATSLSTIASAAKTPVADDLTKLATFYALEEAKRYNAQAVPAAQDPRVGLATQVAQLYQLLLNRSPEPGGLNVWINFLQKGGTRDGLASFMLEGFEARDDFPASLSNRDFIARLYSAGLGRAAGPSELQHFAAKLDSGMTRGQAVISVLDHIMSSNIGTIVEYTTRTRFMGKVSDGLALAAKAADAYAKDMVGAVGAASDIAQKKPVDYASSATSGIETIVSQALIGPASVDRITVDRWGNVMSVADPRNTNWKIVYTYNVYNQVTSESKPTGYGQPMVVVKTEYDKVGRVTSTTDGKGTVSAKQYDHNGNLVLETNVAGQASIAYTVNTFGERTTVQQGNGVRTAYTYDFMGNQISRTTAPVNVYAINQATNVLTSRSGAIVDRYFYDELGRRVQSENSNSTVDTSTFKDLNRTTSTLLRYDASGNAISTTNALGETIKSVFDAFNHKVSQLDAINGRQQWEVDAHGRTTSQVDLSGVKTAFEYNAAGQLVLQTKGDLSIAYEYADVSGQLTRVIERKPGAFAGAARTETVTTYDYDRAGNRTVEKVMHGAQGGTLDAVQDQSIAYDAQGRVERVDSTVANVGYQLAYLYDNNGNRTKVTTSYVTDGAAKVITVDNGFDHLNRQTSVSGTIQTTKEAAPIRVPSKTDWDYEDSPSTGPITSTTLVEAHTITYDGAGNRETDAYKGKTDIYKYDDAGRLSAITSGGQLIGYRYYDGSGRVVQTLEGNEVRSSVYDRAGRMIQQRVTDKSGKLQHSIHYANNGAGGYDAMGNLQSYRVVQGTTTTTYTMSYQGIGAYLETGTVIRSDKSNVAHQSTRTYDAVGKLIHTSTQGADGKIAYQVLVNDIAGQVLWKNKDRLTTNSLIVAGNYIGSSDRLSESFRSVIEPINAPSLSAAPSTYIVQQGDTLQSIANAVWGDASLWWMIADANGLTGGKLTAGVSLTLPTRANIVNNDYDTFKPYDSAKAVGDTAPTLPVPAADKGCGVVGSIIMVAVAVVVTIYTAGAASGLAATPGMGANFSAGLAVTGGTSTLTTAAAMGAGAIGGAAGSLASQAVGIASGIQSSFNWKGVALSALGGAIGAGLAKAAPTIGMASGSPTVAGSASQTTSFSLGQLGITMAKAGISSALTQGVGSVVGLQESFSWRSVAATAVGAGVGYAANAAIGNSLGNAFNGLARGTVSGIAAGAATQKISNGKIDLVRVAADAFGNALGNSFVSALNSTHADQEARTPPPPKNSYAATAVAKAFQLLLNGEDGLGVSGNSGGLLQLTSAKSGKVGAFDKLGTYLDVSKLEKALDAAPGMEVFKEINNVVEKVRELANTKIGLEDKLVRETLEMGLTKIFRGLEKVETAIESRVGRTLATELLVGIYEAVKNSGPGVGKFHELVVAQTLELTGLFESDSVRAIQNNSDHGVDLVAKSTSGKYKGQWLGLELKASGHSSAKGLTSPQADGPNVYVRSRLNRAVDGGSFWIPGVSAPKGLAAFADKVLTEQGVRPFQGFVVKTDRLYNNNVETKISEWLNPARPSIGNNTKNIPAIQVGRKKI